MLLLKGDKMKAHNDNLKNKIQENYKDLKDKLIDFYNDVYLDLSNKLSALKFSKDNEREFIIFAKLIDDYLQTLDNFSKENNITSQSKFRSTFLEEISYYLFKDLDTIKKNNLNFYNKGIFSGIKFDQSGKILITTKDVDFCIGKKVAITIEGVSYTIILPLINVEVKTYLDATMFGEVQYSARLLKNSSPLVKNYVIMEYTQLSNDKIINARNDNAIDEMFAFRENANTPIEHTVLKEYFIEINKQLELNNKKEIKKVGKILKR